MSKTAINDLQALIRKLQDQRQAHIAAIEDIDAAFGSLGIKPQKRRGRPRAAIKSAGRKIGKAKIAKKTRRRKKYKMSGSASVLTLVARAGKKGVTGTQIAKHWKAQGRSGNCYKTTGMLINTRKLKRTPIKGQKRGSIYVAV